MSGARWLGLLAGIMMLVGLVAVPEITYAQATNVEPRVGPSGTEFAFFAEGFDGGEQVGVWINNPDGTVSEIVDENNNVFVLFANSNGRADWFTAVTGVDGFYGMVARGVESGYEVVIPFEVRAGGTQPQPQPTPPPTPPPPASGNVDPAAGRGGTEFAFAASGFSPGEAISFWINAPDGSVLSVYDQDNNFLVLSADNDGRIEWSVASPTSAPAGFYSMVAHGNNSGHEVIIPFQILP